MPPCDGAGLGNVELQGEHPVAQDAGTWPFPLVRAHRARQNRRAAASFHKSFNLFTVDLGDISFHDERSTPKGEKLVIRKDIDYLVTPDGTPVTVVRASDRIEVLDMGDILSVGSLVNTPDGTGDRQFVDPQITAGISGATINMTGLDPNKLAHAYQANGGGTLVGQSDLDVHMTNGKTVRIFLGTGM